MRSRPHVWMMALVVPALSGCVEAFGTDSPHEPGAALGTFHVTAKMTANDCGDGALGAPLSWEFDVKLAWEDDSLFWNSGGEVLVGTLSEDGQAFEIGAGVVMNMRDESNPEDLAKAPCSVVRQDTAVGTLTREGAAVSAFAGTLSYAFAPTADSQCADLVTSETPTFASLPCSMRYAFEAPRTGD